jgi:hypothetical protein
MTVRQIDALVSCLDGQSKEYAVTCARTLETVFDTQLPIEWCNYCCAFRRLNSHTHHQDIKDRRK